MSARDIRFYFVFSCLLFPSIRMFAAQVEVQEKLQYESNVTLKLVQVYVLDKNGNAVSDLIKSEFEIYDDGQVRPITDFEKHDLILDHAPLVLQPRVPFVSIANTNRKFFFFFDFAFNNVAGISKSRKAALDFLDTQVQPDDLVGVLSFVVKQGLTLHEYLTSDHRRIKQVIEELGSGKFMGRAWRIESEWLKDQLKLDKSLGDNVDSTKKIMAVEITAVKREAFDFASQVSELAKALRTIPGIKNIILFSSGIPNHLLYGSDSFRDETGSGRGSAALRDSYAEMCKELIGSNSAVYAINAAGSVPVTFEESDTSFDERDLKGDGALRLLAEESGGKYFDSINSYKNINNNIQKVTGTYYVLGYYLDEKKDGRFHNVRIVVKRKGCSVFGQKGYFDTKPFSEYSENEKILHIMDLALADNPLLQVPAEVPLAALPIMERGKLAIIAFLRLPRRVAASALANTAEAMFMIFDEKGEMVSTVPLRIVNPNLDNKDIELIFTAPARPGRAVCRVALCNMKTGYGVRGSRTLTVPELRETVLWLDPPLFLTDRRIEDTYTSPGASLENLYAYDPREYSLLQGDVPAGTKTLRAALRVTTLNPETEIELTAELIEMSGTGSEFVPVDILREFTDGPMKRLLVDLALGELNPGRYILSLIAREKGGQAVARTAAMLTVK